MYFLCISLPYLFLGMFLDSFARKFLWSYGLDYLHGTSHGVGAFLNVHEGICAFNLLLNSKFITFQFETSFAVIYLTSCKSF